MKTVVFAPDAIQQLQQFKSGNQKLVFKIFKLIENIQQTPFSGIGKPEALKGNLSGFWSRRINHEHRLVYKVSEEYIFIYSCLGHYSE
ncbi:MAG TPA: Txe/YoeB family addiction module toxin [Niabella sp.]|nr:Txe/YoeB family addiction module toxin [Niabella sp.]HOZ95858.1 Txe/YoeB family addiction module toxin [Niabella sp.]HQW13712.1 Txe/YoeB family addiction module toxin [Niabella sp.]HQX19107.1 Txe/YoeB family addiction module toxin [Niabella sp.]HRB06396.1 Txe/YoeB family addiction module toxin [Niabella sp.]